MHFVRCALLMIVISVFLEVMVAEIMYSVVFVLVCLGVVMVLFPFFTV